MFGIGHLPELILILVLALIFVGPGKLPAVGAALGKSIQQFRKATSEVEDEIRGSVDPAARPRREIPTTPQQQHYLSPDREQPVEHVTTAESVDRSTTAR